MLARGLLIGSAIARGRIIRNAVRSPVAAPAVTSSPHRVGTVPRLRAVRCFAQYATTLFPDSEVLEFDKRFDVNRYNDQLGTKLVIVDRISTNKQKLKTAFREYENLVGPGVGDAQTWAAHKMLMLAMAMQESNHMDVRQRDDTKDVWDPQGRLSKSANCSVFNLSVDFVEMSGYYAGRPGRWQLLPTDKFNFLNSDAGLTEAIGILECAFAEWGVENSLAFVRQGRDGYEPAHVGRNWRQQRSFVGVAGPDVPESDAVVYNICEYLRCIKRSMRYIEEHSEVWDNADRPDIPCRHI